MTNISKGDKIFTTDMDPIVDSTISFVYVLLINLDIFINFFSCSWGIPDGTAGGDYKFEVSYPSAEGYSHSLLSTFQLSSVFLFFSFSSSSSYSFSGSLLLFLNRLPTNHSDRYAFSQREFNIRVFRPPRLKTELVFVKKGYFPHPLVPSSPSLLIRSCAAPLLCSFTPLLLASSHCIFIKIRDW